MTKTLLIISLIYAMAHANGGESSGGHDEVIERHNLLLRPRIDLEEQKGEIHLAAGKQRIGASMIAAVGQSLKKEPVVQGETVSFGKEYPLIRWNSSREIATAYLPPMTATEHGRIRLFFDPSIARIPTVVSCQNAQDKKEILLIETERGACMAEYQCGSVLIERMTLVIRGSLPESLETSEIKSKKGIEGFLSWQSSSETELDFSVPNEGGILGIIVLDARWKKKFGTSIKWLDGKMNRVQTGLRDPKPDDHFWVHWTPKIVPETSIDL